LERGSYQGRWWWMAKGVMTRTATVNPFSSTEEVVGYAKGKASGHLW
jgi:hypothetical protein